MTKTSWRSKLIAIGFIASIALTIFLAIKPESSSIKKISVVKTSGFSSEVLQFEDINIQLLDSSHTESEQTFHFNIENTRNSAISVTSTSFKIKNNGKSYSSDSVLFDENRLNPGMNTTATVTFKMKNGDILEGEPMMEITRGLFFGDIQEFQLKR